LILALCDGPVAGIDEVWFGSELVVDREGNFADSKWTSSYVRINKHLGGASQVADPDAVSEIPEWTDDHRLLGVAYIYVRLKHNQSRFPNGLPNISASVRGRNIVRDGRDDSYGYSRNRALVLADYLSHPVFGPKMDFDTEFDHPNFDAAVNACDELVDLKVSGTFTVDVGTEPTRLLSDDHGLVAGQLAELTGSDLPAPLADSTSYYVVRVADGWFEVSTVPDGAALTMTDNGTGVHSWQGQEHRYTFDGVVDVQETPEDVIRRMALGMAGVSTFIGGQWSVFPGVWDIPSFTVNKDNIIGEVTITPRRSRRDRLNTVKGFYLPEKHLSQPTAYPTVQDAAAVAADGEELIMQLDLSDVRTASMAQRVAKILLANGRKEKSVEVMVNLEGVRCTAGRVVLLDLPELGINDLPFRVDGYQMDIQDGKLGVRLSLTETDPAIYGWVPATDEKDPDETDPPFYEDGIVQDVINFDAINASGVATIGEARVDFTWDPPFQAEVIEGGFTLIEYRETGEPDSEWRSVTYANAFTGRVEWNGAMPNKTYDFRAKYLNQSGALSENWAYDNNHTTTINSTDNKRTFVYDNPTPQLVHVINHNFGRPAAAVTAWIYNGGTPNIFVDHDQLIGAVGDENGINSLTLTFTAPVGIKAFVT